MATVNFIHNAKQSSGALGGAKRYVEKEEKTFDKSLGMRLISGQNCTPQFADKEFLATRMMHHKDSPVYFYHYTQSFSPEEKITGQQAHEIAKEFAAKAWPESEVLIATHIDAAHIHSHFIVNAVCHESGKMLRQGPNTLKQLRQISDEICLAHGLSVLSPQPEQKVRGMGTREYRSAEKGESWKFQLMNTIDYCMRRSKSKDEFIRNMRDKGYDVKWTDERKNITYTTPTNKRCRDDRLHEKKYFKEMMEREFRIRAENIYGRIETAQFDSVVGETSDRRGMAEPIYNAERAVPHNSGAVRPDEEHADPIRNEGADGQSDQGASDDFQSAGTGWEEERASLLDTLSAYQSSQTVTELAVDPGDLAGLVGGVVQLGYSLEHLSEPDSVIDATTRAPHIDRKRMKELQQKKVAMGHKPDDHEEQHTWQQTM